MINLQDGRDIIAAFRDRGLRVQLDGDSIRLGPRNLVDVEADGFLLREHRASVLAALQAER